jgi:hypothetical protein
MRDSLGSVHEETMTPPSRHHFQRSLTDVLAALFQWVQGRPSWLRPALYGSLLMYGLVIWRGGLILVPIGTVVLFIHDRALMWRLLLTILVLAPAGGFAGGLVWGALTPLLNPLGKVGKVFKYVVGTWIYAALLVFLIIPTVKPTENIPPAVAWGFVAGWGLLIGICMGLQSEKDAA